MKRAGTESANFITKIRCWFSRLTCQQVSSSRMGWANPAARIVVAIIIYIRMFSVLESNVTDKRCLPCSHDPGLPLSSVFVVEIVFDWRHRLTVNLEKKAGLWSNPGCFSSQIVRVFRSSLMYTKLYRSVLYIGDVVQSCESVSITRAVVLRAEESSPLAHR